MRRNSAVIVAVALVALGLMAGEAFAQSAKVELPFSFTVAKKELPAGEYEVRVDGAEMKRVTVRNVASGEKVQAAVMFRLANTGVTEVKLAFDVADGMHYLSELHFPNMDGYAIAGAPGGEHGHEMVKAKP